MLLKIIIPSKFFQKINVIYIFTSDLEETISMIDVSTKSRQDGLQSSKKLVWVEHEHQDREPLDLIHTCK